MRLVTRLTFLTALAFPVPAAAETTVLINREAGLTGAPSSRIDYGMTPDARYVLLKHDVAESTGQFTFRLVRRDVRTGDEVLVNRSDGDDGAMIVEQSNNYGPLSADGRYAMFTSGASNHPDAYALGTVYRRDVEQGRTVVASRADGAQGAIVPGSGIAMSADGDRVVFVANGKDLGEDPGYGLWLRDISTGRTAPILRMGGRSDLSIADLSADGRTLVYAYATERALRAHDLLTGADEVISSPTERPDRFLAAVSDDGRMVAYQPVDESHPQFLGPILRLDRSTGERTVVSRQDDPDGAVAVGGWPEISGDGGTVAFATTDAALGASEGAREGSWQVYSRDVGANATTLESRGQYGRPSAGRDSWFAFPRWLSTDGSSVGFGIVTNASNLVADLRVPGLDGGLYGLIVRGDLPAPQLADRPPVAVIEDLCAGTCPARHFRIDLGNSFDVEAPISAWTFDFGDGTMPLSGTGDELPVVEHTYASASHAPAQLTVRDSAGATDSATFDPRPPPPPNETTLTAPPIIAPPAFNGVSARLTRTYDGAPLPGMSIRFRTERSGQVICSAVTDADGTARCEPTGVLLPVIDGGFRASYAGNGYYWPSEARSAFPGSSAAAAAPTSIAMSLTRDIAGVMGRGSRATIRTVGPARPTATDRRAPRLP